MNKTMKIHLVICENAQIAKSEAHKILKNYTATKVVNGDLNAPNQSEYDCLFLDGSVISPNTSATARRIVESSLLSAIMAMEPKGIDVVITLPYKPGTVFFDTVRVFGEVEITELVRSSFLPD